MRLFSRLFSELSSSAAKKLKVLELEVEMLRGEGARVPSRVTPSMWNDLLSLGSRSQRTKQLSFWWLNERKKENDKKKKLERRERKEEKVREASEDDGHIRYGFKGSNIFLRIYDQTIDNFHNGKLFRAMMYGQNLVLDCGYDKHMNVKEAQNCAKQLMILFAENRVHSDPFNLHFCNARRDSETILRLHKFIPTLYNPEFPINITEKSYLDLFAKERLVYLTPHCREELVTYSHDDIYIIGEFIIFSFNYLKGGMFQPGWSVS